MAVTLGFDRADAGDPVPVGIMSGAFCPEGSVIEGIRTWQVIESISCCLLQVGC